MIKCTECNNSYMKRITTYSDGKHVYRCNLCNSSIIVDTAIKGKAQLDEKDDVNHPQHYSSGMQTEVECNMFKRCLPADLSDAFKYVWRAGDKDGNPLEKDLNKALWYLDDAVEHASYIESCYNKQTSNLVNFLPKNYLKDWKYSVLACILQNKIEEAISLIQDKLGHDPAS